ncbi:MAG: hypothetical protein K2X47_15215 [Bdellovibrionales bacterium]|nr:hypothetical protein [Bdellovibrionales bacterium]
MRIVDRHLRFAGVLLLSFGLTASVGMTQEKKKTKKSPAPAASAAAAGDAKPKAKKAAKTAKKAKSGKASESSPSDEVSEAGLGETRFYRVLIPSPLPDDQEREIARMTDEFQASRDGKEDFQTRRDRSYVYKFLLSKTNTQKFLSDLTRLGSFSLVEPEVLDPIPDGKVRFEVLVEKTDLPFMPRDESRAKPPEYVLPVSVSPAALGGPDDFPKIFYSIQEGRDTQLGPFVLKKDSFLFEVAQRSGDPTLVMRWPQFLTPAGEIQVLNAKGTVLWSKVLEAKATTIVKRFGSTSPKVPAKTTKEKSAKGTPAQDPAPAVEGVSAQAPLTPEADPIAQALPQQLNYDLYSYEAEDLDSDDMTKWSQQGGFRICLASPAQKAAEVEGEEKSDQVQYSFRYCSRKLKYNAGKKATVSADKKTTIEASLNGKPIPLTGVVNIDKSMGINLKFSFKTGDFWEWKEKKPRVDIADIVGRDDGTFEIRGRGVSPWGSKVADFDSWSFEMKARQVELSFISPWGLPLTQKFQVPDNIVAVDQRPLLHENTVHQTYQDEVQLSGFAPGRYKLAAAMGDVRIEKGGEFEWTFPTGKKGANYRRSIKVWDKSKSFVGTYDIHRGFPGELNVRVSTMLAPGTAATASTPASSTTVNFLGEFAGTYWFESIAGWDNTLFSRQRWGLFGSYTNNVSSSIRFTSTHFELKYRLSPGLWNRNESLGLIAVNHGITYRSIPAQLVGGGLFWARSMPDVFDSVMNLVPWFRYPKYVEAKVMLLPLSLGTDVTSGLNLVMFFQGKMIVTPRLFLEAGISVRRYSYEHKTLFQSITSFFASGTLGVGYLF